MLDAQRIAAWASAMTPILPKSAEAICVRQGRKKTIFCAQRLDPSRLFDANDIETELIGLVNRVEGPTIKTGLGESDGDVALALARNASSASSPVIAAAATGPIAGCCPSANDQ